MTNNDMSVLCKDVVERFCMKSYNLVGAYFRSSGGIDPGGQMFWSL